MSPTLPATEPEKKSTLQLDQGTKIYLHELSQQYPTIDAALAKIASLRAMLTLPKGTIHVVSDIHGEFKKLKHIINNASGSLRPLVDQIFGDRLSPAEKLQLLNVIYYPRETYARLEGELRAQGRERSYLRKTIRLELEILRELVRRYSLEAAEKVFPQPYRELFRELVFEPQLGRDAAYLDTIVDEFMGHEKGLDLLRFVARLIRNLLVSELVVGGDLGDRGLRIDRVIDYIMRQPNVAITWGNHDASWMGACLGHEACIATVLRISMRYRRLSQLEEGYGIPVAPLEKLVRTVYGDDPATCFACKGEGMRDPTLMARMQKAIAIMQFKLEGQLIDRNPQFQLEHRNLLHRIDPEKKTVVVDGKEHLLRDSYFPTIDWKDPYRLSADEANCMARLRESFLQSPTMWRQMLFVERRGSMYLRRDNNLIFHACVPVDEQGDYLPLAVDGIEYRGRALFDALNRVVHRSFRDKAQSDLDLLWYLWGGPRSPWFGKDKMATFETYLIADKATHKEIKNPYFKLIHDADFCRRILQEFDIDPQEGLIVNGHVPVKIEEGESPLKKSGQAVTIDGAFSEAYGDKGYTLILESSHTSLAQHHHFESVTEAITQGADIIPTIQNIKTFERPRTVADTERGDELRHHIELLELLIKAYQENVVVEEI